MATLPPPLSVSPLIKFGRWTALLAGVMWGIHRHNSNTKKENAYRAYEKVQKPIRDAKLNQEKKRAIKEELLYMAKETGVPIPKDFHEKY